MASRKAWFRWKSKQLLRCLQFLSLKPWLVWIQTLRAHRDRYTHLVIFLFLHIWKLFLCSNFAAVFTCKDSSAFVLMIRLKGVLWMHLFWIKSFIRRIVCSNDRFAVDLPVRSCLVPRIFFFGRTKDGQKKKPAHRSYEHRRTGALGHSKQRVSCSLAFVFDLFLCCLTFGTLPFSADD